MSKKSKKATKSGQSVKTHTMSESAGEHSVGPFQSLERQLKELEQRFDQFIPHGWMDRLRPSWPDLSALNIPGSQVPKVDILDRRKELLVRAEAPGMDKEDIDVSLSENSITIKGSMQKTAEKKEGDYLRKETMQRSFCRSLPLESEIDISKAKAKFKNGMLEVRLPKLKKSRRQSVKVD